MELIKMLFSDYSPEDWLTLLLAVVALVVWVWSLLVIIIVFGGVL